MSEFPPHPMAMVPNQNSGNGIGYQDRFIASDGRHGRMDEALHDGEAFVTMDDGSHEIMNWHQLRKIDDSNQTIP